MKTNPNAPINVMYDEPNVHEDNGGLTKREYFAAMAMQGLLASPDSEIFTSSNGVTDNAAKKARFCCDMADALITQLNK